MKQLEPAEVAVCDEFLRPIDEEVGAVPAQSVEILEIAARGLSFVTKV